VRMRGIVGMCGCLRKLWLLPVKGGGREHGEAGVDVDRRSG